MVLFGTNGIINHLTLIFAVVYSLGGFVFRKNIANEMLDMNFSVIGCIAASMISFIIADIFFESIKILLVISLAGWLAGGFGIGGMLGDGEAS